MSEQSDCRRPVVASLNAINGVKFLPNATGRGYMVGRPDGEVLSAGRMKFLEFKAGYGSLFLGSPGKEKVTTGLHFHQREWIRLVADHTGMEVWIAAWVKRDRDKKKGGTTKGVMFVLPVQEWYSLERDCAPRMTIALTPELEKDPAYKRFNLMDRWSEWIVPWRRGAYDFSQHPFLRSI